MIAVLARETEHPVVAEFFQLFKTRWCFHQQDSNCDVLICANGEIPQTSARVIIAYSSSRLPNDQSRDPAVLRMGNDQVPIYGQCAFFGTAASPLLANAATGEAALMEERRGNQTIIQIGYDLLAEIRHLLTQGQPARFAKIPTLDLHIALLRDLLLRHEVPFAEIPPVPVGYNFTACLTHDIDHPRVRDHVADHTMFGFLFRATVGSWIEWSRGRKNFAQVLKNLAAVFKLPMVYLGLAPDFWNQFDRYREMEGESKSTFFVIPTKGDAGLDADGSCQSKRAARYDLKSIAAELRRLLAAGCEVAVHGIDAWRDSEKGKAERARVREITGAKETGVRMHWLYFNETSPAKLDAAGYSYDSTMGYNNAVGYRAGTGQVFKPFQTQRLLELPLHLMDTALFYPSHMNLSQAAAREEINAVLDNAARFGGVVTVNWHDRSIAPERLWDRPYVELLHELKQRGAWMPTANDAVAWFRKRRAATGEEAGVTSIDNSDNLPGLRIQTHQPRAQHATAA